MKIKVEAIELTHKNKPTKQEEKEKVEAACMLSDMVHTFQSNAETFSVETVNTD